MLADTLRECAGKRQVDSDGAITTLELLPPATPEQVRALEARLPSPLPDEIREALAVTTGFVEGPVESFSLLDLEGFGLEAVFPDAYSIAHDGYGNYWVLDLLPSTIAWGPVYYACHDPAVIAYQAPSVEAFVKDLVARAADHPGSAINEVHEEVVMRLWRDHSSLIPQPVAAAGSNPLLREFAATLAPDTLIADLREARLGSGFPWGRYGPRTDIQRFGTHPIWAIAKPAAEPGLLARLYRALTELDGR